DLAPSGAAMALDEVTLAVEHEGQRLPLFERTMLLAVDGKGFAEHILAAPAHGEGFVEPEMFSHCRRPWATAPPRSATTLQPAAACRKDPAHAHRRCRWRARHGDHFPAWF